MMYIVSVMISSAINALPCDVIAARCTHPILASSGQLPDVVNYVGRGGEQVIFDSYYLAADSSLDHIVSFFVMST